MYYQSTGKSTLIKQIVCIFSIALKSQIDQLQKQNSVTPEPKLESKKTMNQSPIQQKMNSTIESLVKIQLGFGSAASELSEQLTTQASLLAEIREAVDKEVVDLKQLHNLEISEDVLDTLLKYYEDNYKGYQEEFSQRYEVLSQEVLSQHNIWVKEQEKYKLTTKERNESLHKNRQREAAEYKYDLELQRKLQTDEYEQLQKGLFKELEELQQETYKQWNEKEKLISELEKQFEESKAKVEAFPKEKEAAIKKATEEGRGIAYYQAKIKSDLSVKEVDGQKRFYEQRLQSLEQTISNQDGRIQNLTKQLDDDLDDPNRPRVTPS